MDNLTNTWSIILMYLTPFPLSTAHILSLTMLTLLSIATLLQRHRQHIRCHTPRHMTFTAILRCIQSYPNIDMEYLKYIQQTGTFSILQPRSSKRRMLRDGIIYYHNKKPRLQPRLAIKVEHTNTTHPTQLYI